MKKVHISTRMDLSTRFLRRFDLTSQKFEGLRTSIHRHVQ